MRFGIYAEMQTPPGKSHSAMTWEILRQIEHADQVGFDVYSVIDHHFFQKFSISANPLALFAAAAQHTERIRFRVALFTLPLENPMRLAGQIAEADILTQGRLECGLGRGHAWLFAPSAMPLEESRPRYEEAIEILERAWTTDRFSYDGKFYNVKDVRGAEAGSEALSAALYRRNKRHHLPDGRGTRVGDFGAAAFAVGSAGEAAGHL